MFKWLSRLPKLPISDTRLVAQAKRGHREAFGKLYLKYIDSIYRYMYFRINQQRTEAEDLTEIVFFKAWKSLHSFNDQNFRAWLYQIAHNTIIDKYREKPIQVSLDERLSNGEDSFEEQLDKKVRSDLVKKALAHLTEEQREVVTLKFIEGLENDEISKILDKTEEAIRALQSRGLKDLRRILKANSGVDNS